METLFLLFELVALGLTLGMILGILIQREGVSVPQNLVWGILGALVTGLIAILLHIGHEFLFAMVGTLAVLFLVNVFHQHHVEDLFGNIDRGIRIHRKKR